MNKKTCSNCEKNKIISAFYRDRTRPDGREYYCKNCANILAREKRERNKETVKLRHKRYYDKHRENINFKKKDYYQHNKYKFSARGQVKKALKSGLLIKPNKCDYCGLVKKIEAHHNNYNKPLKIIWLCKLCHNRKDFMKSSVALKENYN